MKLLAYTDASAIGGAETVLGHLLAGLDSGIEATVLGVHPEVVEAIAGRRRDCRRAVTRAVRHKGDLGAIAAHARIVRRLDPDVIHVNLQSPWAGQYGILAGILGRYPVVAVEHSVFPSTSSLQRVLRRGLERRLAAHVGVAERSARSFERVAGLRPGSLEVIYNGVPDVPAMPVDRPVPGPIVGTAGRFVPEKSLDTLIAALAMLPAEVSCVLVGDGPERRRLEALAAASGAGDRIVFTGWVPHARDYLAIMDVVAIPSRFEGFPLAMVEAMLAERPIVASAVGSIPEAIEDGVTGRLIPVGDAGALASAIGDLLTDPATAARLGAEARRRAVARFTVERMVDAYEQLYERVARR